MSPFKSKYVELAVNIFITVICVLAFAGICLKACGSTVEVGVEVDINKEVDIVYCGTEWCSGCKLMKPIIKELDKKYEVYYAKQSEFTKYKVRILPTTIIYRNGAEVKRFIGEVSKAEILPYLKKKRRPYPLYGDNYYTYGDITFIFYGTPSGQETARALKLIENYPVYKMCFSEIERYSNIPALIAVDKQNRIVKRLDNVNSQEAVDEFFAYFEEEAKFIKSKELPCQSKKITVVVCGFSDRAFTIKIMARILKSDGIELIHTTDYKKYGVTKTPTIIFFENGKEIYRFESIRAVECN